MNDLTLLLTKAEEPYLTPPHTPKPFMTFSGTNPLVAAAMPLLLLIIKLKNTSMPDDVEQLRQQVINEINAFEGHAKSLQCTPALILAARYCLCAALDEVVLLTTWGHASTWPQQSLLSIIHKETWGGERFFSILEKMAAEPAMNLPLLELLYIILSLGFEGKYYNQDRMVRDEIRHRLFRLITSYRKEPDKLPASECKPTEPQPALPAKRLTYWQLAAITISMLFVLGIIFNTATYFAARKTLQELTDITKAPL